MKIFLVDVTAPFWRHGLGQCRANYFRSEAVQRDNAFDDNFEAFKRIGNDRSRWYRLTENLVNLEEPLLLEAFTQYYRTYQRSYVANRAPAQLVLHQFELHPGLKDLPKAGYRMDKLLWVSR